MPASKKFPKKAEVWGQLNWYQKQHGKSPKWALANYKQLYGVWPRDSVTHGWEAFFGPPGMDLASWIQSRRIAYARRNPRWTDDNVQNERPAPKGAVANVGRIEKQYTPGTMLSEEDWENFR